MSNGQIRSFGPSTKIKPKGVVIDATHTRTRTDADWTLQLSPFYLGPIALYSDYMSWNLENAWQGCKAYCVKVSLNGDKSPVYHLDANGIPTEEYWKFAKRMWNRTFASRYPMGRYSVAECIIWNSQALSLLEARRQVFMPLYVASVLKTEAYARLIEMRDRGDEIAIFDYNGYDLSEFGYSFNDALNDTNRQFGHSIILKALLNGEIEG